MMSSSKCSSSSSSLSHHIHTSILSYEDMMDSLNRHVADALVLVDSGSLELLHWMSRRGVMDAVVSGHSIAVIEMEDMNSVKASSLWGVKHVVLVITDTLGSHCDTLKTICEIMTLESMTILCTISPRTHEYISTNIGEIDASISANSDEEATTSAYHGWTSLLLRWCSLISPNIKVEVLHFPLTCIMVSPDLLLTPQLCSRHDCFPLLPADLATIRSYVDDVNSQFNATKQPNDMRELCSPKCLSDVRLAMLPPPMRKGIVTAASQLADIIHDVLKVNDIDFYVSGASSKLVAYAYRGLQSHLKLNAASPLRASVIIVDRTLDLVGSLAHSEDNLVDRVLDCMNSGLSTDVFVPSLCMTSQLSIASGYFLNGSFVRHVNSSGPAATAMSACLWSRQLEALLAVRKALIDALRRRGGTDAVGKFHGGKPTSQVFMSLSRALFQTEKQSDEVDDDDDLIDIAVALANSIDGASCSDNVVQWEQLLSSEKVVLLSVASNEPANAIYSQLASLASEEGERRLTLCNIWRLTAMTHGAWCTDMPDHISNSVSDKGARLFIDTIKNRVLVDSEIFRNDNEIWLGKALYEKLLYRRQQRCSGGDLWSECDETLFATSVSRRITALLVVLRGLPTSRLKNSASLCKVIEPMSGTLYTPLLRRLIDLILNPSRPSIDSDLEHITFGLTGMLKKGFGRWLGSSVAPHPANNPLIVVAVLGGVTASEARHVRASVNSLRESGATTTTPEVKLLSLGGFMVPGKVFSRISASVSTL